MSWSWKLGFVARQSTSTAAADKIEIKDLECGHEEIILSARAVVGQKFCQVDVVICYFPIHKIL